MHSDLNFGELGDPGIGIVIPLSFMSCGERGVVIFVKNKDNSYLKNKWIEVVQRDSLLTKNGKIRIKTNNRIIKISRDDAINVLVLVPIADALRVLTKTKDRRES